MKKIRLISTKCVLSPTQIRLGDYVINPYRGCSFGCYYCYCQYNKNIESLKNQEIGAKINSSSVLEKQLAYLHPQKVLIGSSTEVFQEAEKKFKITENILKILNKHNISYTILTRSSFVVNYLPIIKENKNNQVFFTFNFVDDRLIKLFERNTPGVEEKIKTIEEILKQGISLRIHIAPFIPFVSEPEKILTFLKKLPIKNINIEIYNPKLGNFETVLKLVENNLGEKISTALKKVYSCHQNYINYCQNLKREIKPLEKNFKINYIIPEFMSYYSPCIYYE